MRCVCLSKHLIFRDFSLPGFDNTLLLSRYRALVRGWFPGSTEMGSHSKTVTEQESGMPTISDPTL